MDTNYIQAILSDDADTVSRLLENTDINQHDSSSGYTALHFAAQGNAAKVAQLLIDRGVEIEAVDKHGNTALGTAVMNSRGEGAVITLLLDNGADANHKNAYDNSPLETASLIANYDVKQYFENR